MIVVVTIAILAAVAIPNMLAARLLSNETVAIANLRTLATAQAQFQASAKADVDRDGAGEYGFFRELSGSIGVRTNPDGTSTKIPMQPTLISGGFARFNSDGEAVRSGFHYRVFLPDVNGNAIGELDLTTLEPSVGGATIDADLAETVWCVYAWPSVGGSTGWRTFFTNQRGDITGSEQDGQLRSGPNGIEAREAGYAFVGPGDRKTITDDVAYGVLGRDGNLWKQVK